MNISDYISFNTFVSIAVSLERQIYAAKLIGLCLFVANVVEDVIIIMILQ